MGSGDEEMVIDYGQPLVWTQEDVECLDPVGRDRHYSGSDQGFLYQGCFIRCVIAYEYGRAFIGSGFRRIDVCRYSLYSAGATVASSSFADIIIAAGISGVWGAAMINSGATVLDHLPHGSFFHATGGVADIAFVSG